MARMAADDVLDNGFEAMDTAVEGGTGEMVICNAEPTNYTEAHTTFALARKANPTLTISDNAGAGGGRKCVISAAAGIEVDTSGTATHIALTDGSAKLWFVTTCGSKVLADTDTVDVPAWTITILDPTAP